MKEKTMNEQTQKLIEQLANKFGTTSEYLWSVLVKQAPITATIELIQTILLLFVGWILYKVHIKLLSQPPKQDYWKSYYEKYDAGAIAPMALITLGWGVLMMVCFCAFSTILSGLFNPEFWALDYIMKVTTTR